MKNKKLFILLTALALSLAACGNPVGSSSSSSGQSSVSTSQSSTSNPTSSTSNPSSTSGTSINGIAVTSITLNKTTLSLEETKNETLVATVAPNNASDTRVTWTTSDNTIASVSSLGKVTALKVGTATVTATSVSTPAIKADCAVTVTIEGGAYGSLTKPLTVARALEIAAADLTTAGAVTPEQIYVKGIVSNAPTNKDTYSTGFNLKDATVNNSLLVYTANHVATNVPYQNDEIILKGYLLNYNGTIEIAESSSTKPSIESVTRGTSSVSFVVNNGAINAGAPTSGVNGSKANFGVTAASGYKADYYVVGGQIFDVGSTNEVTIKGNTIVYVVTSETDAEIGDDKMYYEGATTNMTATGNAATVNLDPTLFEVASTNSTGNYAGLNKNGDIRLYNNYNGADKTDGTMITISSTRVTIKSILVVLAGSSVATLADLEVKGDGNLASHNNGFYGLNAGSVTLKNATNATSSRQLHILSVAIFYTMKQEVAATAVELNKSAAELEVGDFETLVATLTPLNATVVPTWSSSDNAVATVDQGGKVSALAEGTATITVAVSETIKATCVVNVIPAEIIDYGTELNPLTVDQAKASMDKEKNKTVVSAAKYYVKGIVTSSKYSATYKNFEIWLQNNDGSTVKAFEFYATVLDESITTDYTAENALVGFEVVGHGYAKIFNTTYELFNYKVGDVYDYPTVLSLQIPSASAVNLDKSELALSVAGTSTLVATLFPTSATNVIAWSSSDEAVATVDQTGKVTAVAAGNATITATAGEVEAEYALSVTIEHGTVITDPLSITEAAAIGASLAHNTATTKSYFIVGYVHLITENSLSGSYNNATFQMADETTNGFEVYRLKPIVAMPTTEYENLKIGAQVTVYTQIKRYNAKIQSNTGGTINVMSFAEIAATGLTIDAETEVEVGKNVTIVSTVAPVYATQKTINWSSGDESIATVDQTGKVTGVAEGTATITAQIGENIVDTCVVTVVAPAPIVSPDTLQFTGATNITYTAANPTPLVDLLNLDSRVFTAAYDKNAATTDIALRTDGIRMYATKLTTNGNKLTIGVVEGYKIDSIQIAFDANYSATAQIIVGENVVNGTDGAYVINASYFTIFNNNIAVESAVQVRFQSIIINFSAVVPE